MMIGTSLDSGSHVLKLNSLNLWSEEIQTLTITLFENWLFQPGPDGVGMKHINGDFGFVALEEALSVQIRIQRFSEDRAELFGSIGEAVKAGWAID